MKKLKLKNLVAASAIVVGNFIFCTESNATVYYSGALSVTNNQPWAGGNQIVALTTPIPGGGTGIKVSWTGFAISTQGNMLMPFINFYIGNTLSNAGVGMTTADGSNSNSGNYGAQAFTGFTIREAMNGLPQGASTQTITYTSFTIEYEPPSPPPPPPNNNFPPQNIIPPQPPLNSGVASRVPGSLSRSVALVNNAPLAFRNAIANLSGVALERAVREITPTGTSASGSSSSGTANTVSGMIFEKAGTFSGDMSASRASLTKLSDAYSMLGALPSSNMQFEQIATTFAANPVSYQPTRMSNRSLRFADAEVSNYDKFESGQVGGWVQGYHDRGHGETIGASTGFVNKTFGVVGALEYAVDQNHLAGVYVAQSKTKSEMYDLAGNVDGNQTMLGFYGQKIEDSFKFSGSVAYGLARYDSTRNITTVANISPARAKYDGDTYLGSLGISRMLKSGENTIEPFALVNYTITQTDGYSESGANGYNLTVGKSRSELGSLTVGSIFMFPYNFEGKKIELKVKPAIRFSDDFKKSDTATSFVGSSTTTIYDARRIDRKTGMIGAELNFIQDKDTSIKFGIDYQEGKDYASYKMFGQYEWKF